MSTQRGNSNRNRPQKHKNAKAFKNDMHDTSHTTKKINSLEFYGLCERCKEIIEWKVKYKKYKPLTVPKKCVKCLEKKVKNAYYIVCDDCCKSFNICSKCSKTCEDLEFAESELEKKRKEERFNLELKLLSERKRRRFLRLLEKGVFTKEDLIENTLEFKRNLDDHDGSEDFDDDEEDDQDDDYDEDEDDDEGEYEDDSDGTHDDEDDEYETLDEDEDEDAEDDDDRGSDHEPVTALRPTLTHKNLKIQATKKKITFSRNKKFTSKK